MLGLTGNKAIIYKDGEPDHGILLAGEVSEPIDLGTYKVLGENVEAGFVINNVQANGTIQKSSTVKEGIYGKSTSNIKVDYTGVDYPTAVDDLFYDGTAQQGVNYDSGCMTIDDNFKATDAGVYYSTVTLKPWYRWNIEADKSTTHTVRFEIKKVNINAKAFEFSDDYDGQVKTHDIKSCFNYEGAGWIGDEGLATATATTLGADAKTYYHNSGSGDTSIQVAITPNEGTNLNNYNINYGKDSQIVINPYELDSSDIEVTATDLVYNAQIQTTRVSVVDTRFGENGKTLVKDRDYVIVENSDTGKDAQDYTLKVTGQEGSNYSTSKTAQYGWKITPASLSLKVVGHSASYKYNGTERSIDGYDLIAVSNPQGLQTEGKVKPTSAEISASRTDIGTSESLPESVQENFAYLDGDTNVHVT
ncbi:MAG: hypothetical protein Q4F54_04015 [Coriobacteriia bacterium]|nr:hypothetical protein [Coriobacteriia bacterium]